MQGFPHQGIEWRSVLVFSALAFLVIGAAGVLADDFSAAISPNITAANLTAKAFNVTVSNTDSLFNITEVRVTLPSGYVFIAGTNDTNSTWGGAGYFANTSATVLVWGNLSINDTLVETGEDIDLSFQAGVPSVSNTHSLGVVVYDNASSSNSTSLGLSSDGTAVKQRCGEIHGHLADHPPCLGP